MALNIGRRVGPYELSASIGAGGMEQPLDVNPLEDIRNTQAVWRAGFSI